MRIPRKITPDGLTDALVMVRYPATDAPPEALFGEFYRNFTALGFSYLPPDATETGGNGVNNPVFFNEDGAVIIVRPGQLWFNGVSRPLTASVQEGKETGNYMGWRAYSTLLATILEPLLKSQILTGFTSVTVRYINVLPWRPLTEQISPVVEIPTFKNLESLPSFDYHLNWPVTENGFQVRLRLTDQIRRSDRANAKGTIFDVEVVCRRIGTTFSELQEVLEITHQKQKEVFFGLLSPDFLDDLHPEYDPL